MERQLGQVDKVESSSTTYNWTIERFDRELLPIEQTYSLDMYHQEASHSFKKKMVSRSFTAGENVGIKSIWHLEIEDKEVTDSVDGSVMLVDRTELTATLVFENCVGGTEAKMPFICHARLSCDTASQNFELTPGFKVIEVKTNGEKYEFSIGHSAFFRQQGVVKTVCFIINLEIFGNEYTVPASGSADRGGRHFGVGKLQTDLKRLFSDDDESSDFIIECDGKHFKVHKTILKARSSVFAAMLNNKEFKECQTNTMVVEDIDQTTMKILLHYIYTGKLLMELMKDSNLLEPVIRGADKYDLSELKNHCFQKLAQYITVESFGPLAVFAHSVRAEKKEMVILKDYYLRNLVSLMKNAEFRNLAAQHPEIIFED